ncbi:MAG: OmpA family protein [Kiritimatiellia bacterium]
MEIQEVYGIAETEYYLRTADGQEYGPAKLDRIQLWCREGRISPDQMISEDATQWLPVIDMPELGFDWLIVLADGTEAGPYHLAMLQEQTAAGNIPPGTLFKHKSTGETRAPTGSEPIPATSPSTSLPVPADEPPFADVPVTEIEAADPTNTASDEQESATEPADNAILVSERLETLTRSAAEAREQLSDTRATIQKLRVENTLLQDQTFHLQEQLTAAEAERGTAESALLQMQNQVAQNETELDNLRAQLAQMQEHYDKLQLENQRQFEQIDDLRATALTNEQSWKRELAVLHSNLDDKERLVAEIADVIANSQPAAQRSVRQRAPGTAVSQKTSELAVPPPAAPPETQRPAPRLLAAQTSPKQAPPPRIQPSRQDLFRMLRFGLLITFVVAGIYACRTRFQKENTTAAQPNNHLSHDQTVTAPIAPVLPDIPEAEEGLLLQPERTNRTTRSQQPASQLDWPILDLPRSSILREENAIRILFHEGLFPSGTRLQTDAKDILLRLANQLQPHIESFSVIIEGHTDAIPVRPGNEQFMDNFALGLARAETVKHFLTDQGRLPSTRIHTASAGQASPPYPNDTPENRARNRTVVISIIP